MRQVLLIIDIQPTFTPPPELVRDIAALAAGMQSVATVERHNETATPFGRQLGWKPGPSDQSLIAADRTFVKYGYMLPVEAIDYLKELRAERVLVCGMQTDTCVLAAGFALFDAGLRPTLLKWLTVGSSLDRSGDLGARLWQHHFGSVLSTSKELI